MRRRRLYLLSGTFQYRFIAVSCLYQFIVLLAFATALFVPVGIHLEDVSLSQPQIEEAAKQFLMLHEKVWAPLCVALILLGLHSVVFSHRIAGPLYRFRAIFTSLSKGDFTVRASIRKNDFLQKEAESLCEMIEGLRLKITDIQTGAASIKAELRDVERLAANTSDPRLRQAVEMLRKRVESLNAAAERFGTS